VSTGYHYQHSGDHGAIGLALLASGNHDATKSQPSPPSISLDTDLAQTHCVSPAPLSAGAVVRRHFSSLNSGATLSAPPTPAQAHAPHLRAEFATHSQPASAYASPWGTPRSGSPYAPPSQQQQTASPQMQQQQMPSPPMQHMQQLAPQQVQAQVAGMMAYAQAQWAPNQPQPQVQVQHVQMS